MHKEIDDIQGEYNNYKLKETKLLIVTCNIYLHIYAHACIYTYINFLAHGNMHNMYNTLTNHAISECITCLFVMHH